MKLEHFLSITEKNVSKAARELGFPHETVRRWVHGERIPRPEAMRKISNWSNGAVTPADFYSCVEPPLNKSKREAKK